MRSRLIALAAMAALFFSPAYAAPVYVPGQQGTVGPNVACTNSDGVTVRCIQPSVTLNDATGAAIGTAGNPLVTSPGTGTTGDVNVKQVNGATVNVGTGAAGTGTQRVTTSTDSTIATVGAVTAITNALPAGSNVLGHVITDTGSVVNSTLQAGSAIIGKAGIDQTTPGTTNNVALDGVVDGATQTVSVTSATTVISLSTTGYAAGSFQITSAGSGNTIVFEASNDNSTWVTYPLAAAPSSFSTSASVSALGLYTFNAGSVAFIRARVSVYGSGTVTITSVLKRHAPPQAQGVVSFGNGLVVQGAAGGNQLPVWPESPGTQVTGASGNVANANAVATLAGAVGKTTFIRGFKCQAAGATGALVVNLTVAGTITGTLTYTFVFPAGVTTAATPIGADFGDIGIASSTTNTSIVVTLPAGGTGNTNASCNAYGYLL